MPVYESIKNADNRIKISAANKDSVIFGWEKAVSFLADKVKAGAKAIAIDGWYGIDYEKIALALKEKIGNAVLLSATDLYLSREEIVKYNQPYVTDDPGFGYCNMDGSIIDIMDKEKVAVGRTVVQAEALDDMGIEMDAVISIEVPDEAIISRMGGRRVCPVCSATYHVEFKPSKDGVHCDNDGAELTLRRDDSPEVVADRLRIYHEQTEPLKDYYASKGRMKIVVGQEKVEDTTKLTDEAIDSMKK